MGRMWRTNCTSFRMWPFIFATINNINVPSGQSTGPKLIFICQMFTKFSLDLVRSSMYVCGSGLEEWPLGRCSDVQSLWTLHFFDLICFFLLEIVCLHPRLVSHKMCVLELDNDAMYSGSRPETLPLQPAHLEWVDITFFLSLRLISWIFGTKSLK